MPCSSLTTPVPRVTPATPQVRRSHHNFADALQPTPTLQAATAPLDTERRRLSETTAPLPTSWSRKGVPSPTGPSKKTARHHDDAIKAPQQIDEVLRYSLSRAWRKDYSVSA